MTMSWPSQGFMVMVAALLLASATPAQSEAPTGSEIITRVLENDPFGLSGGSVKARFVLSDKQGKQKELGFEARSRKHDPPFSKSLVRFSAPPDLAGAGFLQIQNRGADDDRFLFLPELKRSRRISGGLRSTSFMGTDFSFADLDRRDLRQTKRVTRLPDVKLAAFDCYHIEVVPARDDSPYARLELFVRRDNFLPLKSISYDASNVALKELQIEQIKKTSGRWFITRSKMRTLANQHSTVLILDVIDADAQIADDEFTPRNLEKL